MLTKVWIWEWYYKCYVLWQHFSRPRKSTHLGHKVVWGTFHQMDIFFLEIPLHFVSVCICCTLHCVSVSLNLFHFIYLYLAYHWQWLKLLRSKEYLNHLFYLPKMPSIITIYLINISWSEYNVGKEEDLRLKSKLQMDYRNINKRVQLVIVLEWLHVYWFYPHNN